MRLLITSPMGTAFAVRRRAMRFACHLVPLACLLTSGCFLMHQNEGADPPPPAPVADAGPPPAVPDASAPTPVPVPPPPPLECEERRADATCLERPIVTPGVPFELPLVYDVCVCCGETECGVVTDEAGRTLFLTTTLCPDPCDCDGCNTPTTTCEVPALPPGDWNVVVNGAWAFDLPVYDSGIRETGPSCTRHAAPDLCGPSPTARETRPARPDTICVEDRTPSNPAIVRALYDCAGCSAVRGPCVATVEPRTDTLLPPGADIHLATNSYETACLISCTDECIPTEERCVLPALERGSFYRVFLDGDPVTTFTAGDGAALCTTRP